MRKILVFIFALIGFNASAQVFLNTSPYIENFNNIGTALPAGFTLHTSATETALGTAQTLNTSPTNNNNTVGRFNNYQSANGTVADDRALGVRQTGSFGDPGAAFVFQLANTNGFTDLALNFKLQSLDPASPRVTTWRVDYGLGDNPTAFSVPMQVTGNLTTGGSTTSNNTITVDFGNALDNQTGKVWIRLVALTRTTGGGSRATTAIDDFSLSFVPSNPNQPSFSSTSSVAFGNQNINTLSTAMPVDLTFSNLTADVDVAATGEYAIAKTANGVYSKSITYNTAELSSSPITVFAQFLPTVSGPANGTVVFSGGGVNGTAVTSLSGNGIDPNKTAFDFETCVANGGTLADGFSHYSVVGAQTWACSSFGHDNTDASGAANAGNALQINGFASSANNQNEDWLISPAFNITAYNYPLLSYWSRSQFNGAALRLKVSTNYSGAGDPHAAGVTWTDLDGKFPGVNTNVWTKSENIDLSAFKSAGAQLYIAFVYTSTTVDGSRWSLDDVELSNSATPPPAQIATMPSSVDFGYQAYSTTSAAKAIQVTFSNLTADATFSTTGDFTVSTTENGVYAQSATLSSPANATVPVYVKFTPSADNNNQKGTLTITSAGAAVQTVTLSGSSISFDHTLEAVNWNVEWFGHASNGPSDNAKQAANVIKVMKAVNADIYALGEVVNTAALADVVAQIGATPDEYGYYVSPYGSYAQNTSDPDYANAQKMAFIYRKSVVDPIEAPSGLMYTADENDPIFNYWASGRFPYQLKANVTLNGVTKQVNFITLHAKAETSNGSYARRKNAAIAFRDYLIANHPTDNYIIFGDYNDDFDRTISTASEAGADYPSSSYKVMLDDAANFTALTLPLSNAGYKSTVSYNDIIDHVIVSNEMNAYYLSGSAAILTSVTSAVSPDNYGNTTSDHYPVLTRFAFDDAMLPIKLESFAAMPKGNRVDLKWTTLSELQNDYFTVEKSVNGTDFTAVKKVKSKGDAKTKQHYAEVDMNPSNGVSYYRLKQTDVNGSYTYSAVVPVSLSLKDNGVKIAPNPVSNTVSLSYPSVSNGLQVTVSSVIGQKILSATGNMQRINSLLNAKLPSMAKGIYLIMLNDEGKVFTVKLLKQ